MLILIKSQYYFNFQIISMKFLFIIVINLQYYSILSQTFYATTTTNIINICHCDLTFNFCDFNCCCDADCNQNTIDAVKKLGSCILLSYPTYCFDPSYYAYININKTISPIYVSSYSDMMCYSFNTTSNWQSEVTLNQNQINGYLNNKISNLNNNSFYSPYSNQAVFQVVNKMVDSNGKCQTGATSTTQNILFGQNKDITCSYSSTCSANSLNIFTNFLNQNYTIQNNINKTITTMLTQIYNCTSTLTLLVFYNEFGLGEGSLYYILNIIPQQVTSTTSQLYTLRIRFININSALKGSNVNSPSFFPRIPSDIFYPLVYSFQSYMPVIILLLMVAFL